MDETIGVKGGRNERRRRLRITKEFKRKLEAYQEEQEQISLRALEKRIAIEQRITFLKTIPIVLVGQLYETLTENNEKKKELALQELIYRLNHENMFSDKDLERILAAVKTDNIYSLDDELLYKLGLNREHYKRTSEIDLTDFQSDKRTVTKETTESLEKLTQLAKEKEETKVSIQEEVAANVKSTDSAEAKLDKLKNHKIVDEYEQKLKEVRKELRNLIFEYNLISEASDNVYNLKDAEELLERLNQIIKKLEELKKAIAVPDIDKYDDNYLYTLIQDYMESFNNKSFVSDIKDSSLYIMVASKIEEIDSKKDHLQDKLEDKKETLSIDQEKLDSLKEQAFNFEQFNTDLLKFQAEQDRLLSEIKQQMAAATTVSERVQVEARGMVRQSRTMLNLLAASMFLPGARSAKAMATMAATYLYFMNNVMNPRTVTRRYKVVSTIDYHREIENSIEKLGDVASLLKNTSRQIDSTIKKVEKEFAEYMAVLPEVKEILASLEKIRDEINEKEYELARIKEEQEKNLEKNNAKVKTLNYEVEM